MKAEFPGGLDFVADAYTHKKFIGYSAEVEKLISEISMNRDLESDEALIRIQTSSDVKSFLQSSRALRLPKYGWLATDKTAARTTSAAF